MTVYQVIAHDSRWMHHGSKVWLLPAGRVVAEWTSRVNAERNVEVATRRFGGTYSVREVSNG